MIARLAAITFIFICTSIAWMILGATVDSRTNASDSRLRADVQSIWGEPHVQKAPYAEYSTNGGALTHTLAPLVSNIDVALHSEPRQKGLLWYSTYKVSFKGDFAFFNPEATPQNMRLCLPLPAAQAVYDDLALTLDGQPETASIDKTLACATVPIPANRAVQFSAHYRSQGLNTWRYSFGEGVNQAQNFILEMTTNYKDIDFPDNTLAPTEKVATADGWHLTWHYRNLLASYGIATTMPGKLQPGPLASQISYFAPVSLFFFFFVLTVIVTIRNVDLHPVNYFFLAAAFFAFHLLLAYLADRLDIHLSFAISSAVSVFLVVTYLRAVTGMQRALREAALAQVIYLILFSYAFFFEGLTGLSITIGAILTLFVVMQVTAKVRWSDKFSQAPPALPQ